MITEFADRLEGARALGRMFDDVRGTSNLLVLGLPRGGVPIAAEVANHLQAPLDAFVVRKIGAPRQPELAIGAIASGGAIVLNHALIAELGVTEEQLQRVIEFEQAELDRREEHYRGGHAYPDLRPTTVLLVDDGLATGTTMQVAVEAVKSLGARSAMIGVPVGSSSAIEMLRPMVDRIECAMVPEPFNALGQWYRDFRPTSDAEVRAALTANQRGREQEQTR